MIDYQMIKGITLGENSIVIKLSAPNNRAYGKEIRNNLMSMNGEADE